MANKSLGNATKVASMLHSNTLLIEVDGAIRRITMDDFEAAMNEGQSALLHEVAWGIPIKDGVQSSPAWGMVGNTAAYTSYKAKVGRYLMDANGRAAKLHKNNSAVYADGTTLDETKGSVVVIAPRLYYRVVTDAETSIPYLWMSEVPISGHYLANADNGNRICVGAYKGSLTGGKLVSRRGVNFDTSARSISGYWSAAQAFGANWGLMDYDVWRWVAMMCLCETGGNANIQAGIGQGVGGASGYSWSSVLSSDTLRLCGQTAGLGDETGTVAASGANADSTFTSVLGVENFWNLQWEFIQGVFFGSSDNSGQTGTEIFLYKGNRMPSSSELSTTPSGEYRTLTRRTDSGYVQKMIKGEYFDIFPSALGGGSSSYWCDYNYNNATGQVLLVGGSSEYGSPSGPFFACSYYGWSSAYSNFGARPAFYGAITIVDGRSI